MKIINEKSSLRYIDIPVGEIFTWDDPVSKTIKIYLKVSRGGINSSFNFDENRLCFFDDVHNKGLTIKSQSFLTVKE